MTKWIRWWGLGAFVVFAVTLGCVWIFFVDGWVKGLIEGAGTEAVGAKVELDAADLSLFPAGLLLTRLQVTNPKTPMTNAVEIAKVTMGLDGLNLLRRKVIVEEMALEGVRLGTPRAISGVVKPVKETTTGEKGMFGISLPSLEVPDVKNILEKEDLETIRLIETLKTDMQREKETWESRLKELPGKSQVAQYKERIKNLKKAGKGGLEGVLGGVGEVQSLKQDIEQEIESLKGAKKEFEDKVVLLRTRFEQIKTAPQRDIQHLKAKYNLSPQGLANMSQTLLGSEIGSWVREGAVWYERAKPFLEGAQASGGGEAGPQVYKPLRGKGVDVHFKEAHPLPDFLIRLTKVSVSLDFGDVAGTIHNVTNDQPTLGQPTTFAFSGEQLKGVESVTLKGALNHVVPADAKDQLTVQAKGYELTNLVLSKDDKWPVTLASGMGDMNINADLKGQALTAHGTGNLRSLHISAGKDGDTNPLTKSLSNAVTGVSQLSLQADVQGTLEQHDVTLSSDLDRILQDAAGKMVNELAAKFGTELQTAISAKIAEPMQQLKNSLSGFEGMAGELTERVTQHNDILKSLLEKSLPTKELKGLPGGLKLPF
ncbi:MAG: TIGR03545 family protein [Nitrospirota bacterium]|nr:TIGR03545 family protein [Nitrospirota bacterium]MDH5700300.1 TIGR03545 family protein [Nitrospirota bacterium]